MFTDLYTAFKGSLSMLIVHLETAHKCIRANYALSLKYNFGCKKVGICPHAMIDPMTCTSKKIGPIKCTRKAALTSQRYMIM